MIRQAFVQVRLGLPINGSRDHKIKIKDFPDVQVGNQKDWQPREAKKEDIQSYLTPEEVEILASSMQVDDIDDIVDGGETIIVYKRVMGIASFLTLVLIKGGLINQGDL